MALSTSAFIKLVSKKFTVPNLSLGMLKKRELIENDKLQAYIRQMFITGGFPGDDFIPNECDYMLCYLDNDTHLPISIMILRKYSYTPGVIKKFLHIEYGITLPAFEGKGLWGALAKIALLFAHDREYGGVSSYAISHGSQVSLGKLKFKTVTPMKYKLDMSNENKQHVQNMINTNQWKLNNTREVYYQNKITALGWVNTEKGIHKFRSIFAGNANSERRNMANARLKSIRRNGTKFVKESFNNIQEQYMAEILVKHLPKKKLIEYGWLDNGMNIKGICTNHNCGLVKQTRYRPWISHIFTFKTQMDNLRDVTNNMLNLINVKKSKIARKAMESKPKRGRSKTPKGRRSKNSKVVSPKTMHKLKGTIKK